MDLDAFTAVHRPQWERLNSLARKRRLTGGEADELLELYQSTSAQLSLIRSVAAEGALSASLSAILANARTRFTGAKSNVFVDVARFFTISLPAAFYRLRWLTVIVGAVFIVIAALFAAWAAGNPAVLAALGSDASLQQLVNHDFVNYYSENPAASFAGAVWTNNAWIAAQCVALGITGVFVPYSLFTNAQNVGITGGVMFAYGRGDTFFSYILPHGLMELTSIFIASAAGLRIFWAWVSPGPRSRLDSLALEGRSLMTTAVGLVFVLFVSGLVEAYVTPSPLPVWAKITIGALVLAAYWTYTLVLGRRAWLAGERGDLSADDAGAAAPST
ncbi:stage II sporulation protein M [Arthrobacter sp. STN4]|uniref:stage II sporulation protein M n=1 Tax=Arthrobacter sp. STN4 TaxID=2923276 RepID=UPI00211A62EA|nr:stage II sporulation protein M [Arthrobacter sp. STN4]MCQ9163603.1 stage II sporulation protein M [Arthrobacter sp. STN4]